MSGNPYMHGLFLEMRGVWIMFLTTRQKQVLDGQGKNAVNKAVADTTDHLDMNRSTMHGINSNVFNNFREALEVMDEYFPIVEGRMRKHYPEVWDRMRSLRLKMTRVKQ